MENNNKVSRSSIESFLIFSLVILAGVLGGVGYIPSKEHHGFNATMSGQGGYCCDSGDGNACTPIVDASHPTIQYTYNGVTNSYGLLKSNAQLMDVGHKQESGQTATINGVSHPIIEDVTDKISNECGHGHFNQLWNADTCYPIPNQELIYVCMSGCTGNMTCQRPNTTIPCYGTKQTVYNVYFRMTDLPSPGIPDIIKNCASIILGYQNKPHPSGLSAQVTTVISPYPSHESLQLHTLNFTFVNPTNGVTLWLGQWCKPAIYLYPQKKEPVSVKLFPKGNIIHTDPLYSIDGWHVIASPNGQIDYQNKIYDYLYYEEQIPDNLVIKEDKGYVIAYDKLQNFFENYMPKFGLNSKETTQFSDYWMRSLPKAAYYKITVVPQSQLDVMTKLSIDPKPDTILRLGFLFEALDQPMQMIAPDIASFNRQGFSVIEWGAMIKRDKNHNFTCLE